MDGALQDVVGDDRQQKLKLFQMVLDMLSSSRKRRMKMQMIMMMAHAHEQAERRARVIQLITAVASAFALTLQWNALMSTLHIRGKTGRTRRRNISRGDRAQFYDMCYSTEPDQFQKKFHMKRSVMMHWQQLIGHLIPGKNKRNKESCTTFTKIAACQYYFARGCELSVAADVAGVHESTLLGWIRDVTAATIRVLTPIYMKWPPSPHEIQEYQARFALRRGIGNVTYCMDGCHALWHGALLEERDDYQNYKGWQSIQCLAVVHSFYGFAAACCGYPGGSPDTTVYEFADFAEQIKEDPEVFLGPDGMIAVDGGFAQDDFCLLPYREASTDQEKWFNFCHSSTRLVVEQTFGQWKNRFRIVLRGCTLSHKDYTDILLCTMLLHNMCVHNANGTVQHEEYSQRDWSIQQLLERYPQPMCPDCNARQGENLDVVIHCPHALRNQDARITTASTFTMRSRRDHIAEQLMIAKNQ